MDDKNNVHKTISEIRESWDDSTRDWKKFAYYKAMIDAYVAIKAFRSLTSLLEEMEKLLPSIEKKGQEDAPPGHLQSPVGRPDLGNLDSSNFASPPDTLDTGPEFESSPRNFAGILPLQWG